MWDDPVNDVESILFRQNNLYYQQSEIQLIADATTHLFNSIDRTADKIGHARKMVAEAEDALTQWRAGVQWDKIHSGAAQTISKVLAASLIRNDTLAFIPAKNEKELLLCIESIMWNNRDFIEKSLTSYTEVQEFRSWIQHISSYDDAVPLLESVFPTLVQAYVNYHKQQLKKVRNSCVQEAIDLNKQCGTVQEPPALSF